MKEPKVYILCFKQAAKKKSASRRSKSSPMHVIRLNPKGI